MEILELIDKLEAMVNHAKRVPITGRTMIDADKLVGLIDQMRLSVPRNIQEAVEVLERREQILNQTQLDARRIRSSAETEYRARVEESELVKAARKRGEEIVHEAEAKAERLLRAVDAEAHQRRAGADQYAQDVLAKMEEEVANVLATIRAGQRVLSPAEDSLLAAS